jgi:hypothetical protein
MPNPFESQAKKMVHILMRKYEQAFRKFRQWAGGIEAVINLIDRIYGLSLVCSTLRIPRKARPCFSRRNLLLFCSFSAGPHSGLAEVLACTLLGSLLGVAICHLVQLVGLAL